MFLKILLAIALSVFFSCKPNQSSTLKEDVNPHYYKGDASYCSEYLESWKLKAERLQKTMSSAQHKIPEDGRMTDIEWSYQETIKKINDCIFAKGSNEKSTSVSIVSNEPSFSNSCRLINGIRVCDMNWDDVGGKDGKTFMCRHFAWTFTALASKRGLDCNYARLQHPDGERHAVVAYKIKSPLKSKDRYCVMEPQANRIEECWYVPAGQRPKTYPKFVADVLDVDPESKLNDPWKIQKDDYFYSSIPEGEKEKALRELTGYDIRKCRAKYESSLKECKKITGYNPFQDYRKLRSDCERRAKIRFIICTKKQ